jgi:hypothetical protein
MPPLVYHAGRVGTSALGRDLSGTATAARLRELEDELSALGQTDMQRES